VGKELTRRRVDATDLVASPGFVDVHTHFDAQVFWDAYLTPSSAHGVTTVVAGNCGFSIAPLAEDGQDYMLRLLARVEGIPRDSLEKGVPWDWSTFGDYLDAVERVGPALNFAGMVGHSALRRRVLGGACHTNELTSDALEHMRQELRLALLQGAMGLSSSWGEAHFDGDDEPVPSRSADAQELVELCGELRDFPGTQVEFIPTLGNFEPAHMDVMSAMSLSARAPLNWNVLLLTDLEGYLGKVAASDYAASKGAQVFALSYPGALQTRYSIHSAIFEEAIPGWSAILALEPPEFARVMGDPRHRRRLETRVRDARLNTGRRARDLGQLRVLTTSRSEVQDLRGCTLDELAQEGHGSPIGALCDVVASDPQIIFGGTTFGDDLDAWKLRFESWRDPRVVLGASDAGAHVDTLSSYDYTVVALSLARDREAMALPEVIRSLSDVPARLYGLREIGRIQNGFRADIVLFDPQTIGPGPVSWRSDLPGGAGRLYSEPIGIHHVFVNGTEVVSDGVLTGHRPGRVMRSGRDSGLNF
jgi:N-acyl-D-aspartate/D-glutamate deacylase